MPFLLLCRKSKWSSSSGTLVNSKSDLDLQVSFKNEAPEATKQLPSPTRQTQPPADTVVSTNLGFNY